MFPGQCAGKLNQGDLSFIGPSIGIIATSFDILRTGGQEAVVVIGGKAEVQTVHLASAADPVINRTVCGDCPRIFDQVIRTGIRQCLADVGLTDQKIGGIRSSAVNCALGKEVAPTAA